MNCPRCIRGLTLQEMLLYKYRVRHITKTQIKQTKSIGDANNSETIPKLFVMDHFVNVLEWNFMKKATLLEVTMVSQLCLIL